MLTLSLVIAGGLEASAQGEAVRPSVGWRTDGSGLYPASKGPLHWGAERNVVWATRMPGWSNSQPAILGDRLFVGSERFDLVCLRLSDGELLWRQPNDYEQLQGPVQANPDRAMLSPEQLQVDLNLRRARRVLAANPDREEAKARVAELEAEQKRLAEAVAQQPPTTTAVPRTHGSNGYSSPTPVTDGRHVYGLFGNGVVSAFTIDGQRVWSRHVENPRHNWGHSTSPLLVGDTLIVHINALRGLDAATGEEKWVVEERPNWGTSAATHIDGTDVLFTPGGLIVGAHDGRVYARGLTRLDFSGPVIHDGVVYYMQRRSAAYRVPTRLSEKVEPELLWTAQLQGSRHYASPIVHNGLVYTIANIEVLNVVDAATGEVLYEHDMAFNGPKPNSVYGSPVLAGDKIYVGASNGAFAVIQPGRTFKELARNTLEPTRSTPILHGNRMYFRGRNHMFCFEEQ